MGTEPARKGPSALLVTSDSASRGALVSALALTGWRVGDLPTAHMAIESLRGVLPRALILDHRLPDGDGMTVLRQLALLPEKDRIVVALLVDRLDRETAVAYLKAGVKVFLAKPIDLVDAADKLAGQVSGVTRLSAFAPATDPLARPLLVIASPSLNTRDTCHRALADEFDIAYFDGSAGITADLRQASLILVDEGLPAGLDTLPSLRTLFGEAPAFALTSRGADPVDGFDRILTKPLRSGAMRRHARVAADRVHLGLNPMPSGVVIRLREGWQDLEEPFFQKVLGQIAEVARLAWRTSRAWICLDGPYLGARQYVPRTRALLAASNVERLKVGVVTVQPNRVRVAHDLRVPPVYVQASTSDYIKEVQELT